MSSRKIVFVNQMAGYLTIDIINAFASEFDEVAVISWDIRVQDIPLAPNAQWSKVNRYDRTNTKTKFWTWIKATWQIFFLLLFKYRKYDVFYVTIPPMAYLLSLVLPNRFSILVYDLYPDVLKIFNISEKNLLYRIWAYFNKVLFNKAYRLFTLSEGMKKLMSQYTHPDKIEVIPNWTGLTNIKKVDKKDNPFVKEQGLEPYFIVQYSGNIGVTHNVEVLIHVADYLRENKGIFFLIIGRGERYQFIQQLIQQKQLTNCRILPYQPDDMLNYTLAAADLSVVVLDDKSAHVSVPSKIYNIQAVGAPILGIAADHSELANHLRKYKNGVCYSSSQVETIANGILHLQKNPADMDQMRKNSYEASAEFTMRNAEKYYKSYTA